MANTTQIRLQAITGSLVDITSGITGIDQQTAVASLSATDIPDGEALLRYFASSIANIHGQTAFGSNVPGRYVYNSGSGLRKLFPDTDAKMVLGGATLPSMSSVSGLDTGDIVTSTLTESLTLISLDGTNTATFSAGDHIRFQNSSSKGIVYKITAAVGSGDSSMAVQYVPEVSDLGSLSVSSVSTIDFTGAALTSLEWLRVRAQKVIADSALRLESRDDDVELRGAVNVDIHAVSSLIASGSDLNGDFTNGIDLQAGASSEIGLADGLLTLDLNGTDVADGLRVDAEGTVTIDAAAADSGAIILDAEDAAGMIQLQNQGAHKLIVSASQVDVYDVFHVRDATASTAASNGALVVDGGAGFGSTVHMGGDIESDDAMAVLVSSGELRLSGSSGVEFAADGNFSFSGHSAGGILLMDADSEASTYRSNFSATTSIMAALNSLKAQGEPTLFRRVHSGADISAGSAVALTKVEGDGTSFALTLKPNQAEVYVNGQLMLSGSETERAAGTVDYNLGPAADQIKFGFSIVDGDVVSLLDRG